MTNDAIERENRITEARHSFIRDAYREAERSELYERGKELEERYHRPKVEAERDQREAGCDRTQARRR